MNAGKINRAVMGGAGKVLNCQYKGQMKGLTHWGLDKIVAIFQCIFSNENV